MTRFPLQLLIGLLASLGLATVTLAELPPSAAEAEQAVRPLAGVMNFAVELSVAVLVVGMALCLYRLLRGPHLADRVLASDALALHVAALVVVLAIYLRTTDFLDVALVVAILGFASTLAFSQYIAARGGSEAQVPPPPAPERSKP